MIMTPSTSTRIALKLMSAEGNAVLRELMNTWSHDLFEMEEVMGELADIRGLEVLSSCFLSRSEFVKRQKTVKQML